MSTGTLSVQHQRMNGVELGAALNLGEWVVSGIKKANRLFAAQRGEALIFSGRYSTPAKVSAWLDAHPDFVASRYKLKPKPSEAAPAPQPPQQRPPA